MTVRPAWHPGNINREGQNIRTDPTFVMHNIGIVPTFQIHNVGRDYSCIQNAQRKGHGQSLCLK